LDLAKIEKNHPVRKSQLKVREEGMGERRWWREGVEGRCSDGEETVEGRWREGERVEGGGTMEGG
jgi:hypothetical protein